MLRCRGVSCKVIYFGRITTIIYMIISVHPVTLEYVFFLFCLPVVVFRNKPAVSTKMTSTFFVSWCHTTFVSPTRRSRGAAVVWFHFYTCFLQLYFLIFRILNFCKVDFFVDCNTVCVHCLCETIYYCIISVYSLNALAFSAVFRNSNKC